MTVVVPSGKRLPGAWLDSTVGEGEVSSVADGSVKSTRAPVRPVASAMTSAPQARTGAVVSLTETVKVQEAESLAASRAVTETAVVPRAKVVPEAWL